MRINGMRIDAQVDPAQTLLQFIREEVGLTGTKSGCENGECGACAVLMDNKVVRSCIILAAEADGAEIVTVEGLAGNDSLHPVQQAFIDHSAVQCGFCIPGVLVASKALLERNPFPSEKDVMEALGGHLCRCGGYRAMSDAVHTAAHTLAKKPED
jgi:carbon-monoxide dehydrogenase small subunit